MNKIGLRSKAEDNELLVLLYALQTRLRARIDGERAHPLAEALEHVRAADESVRQVIDGPRTFNREPAVITKIRGSAA